MLIDVEKVAKLICARCKNDDYYPKAQQLSESKEWVHWNDKIRVLCAADRLRDLATELASKRNLLGDTDGLRAEEITKIILASQKPIRKNISPEKTVAIALVAAYNAGYNRALAETEKEPDPLVLDFLNLPEQCDEDCHFGD